MAAAVILPVGEPRRNLVFYRETHLTPKGRHKDEFELWLFCCPDFLNLSQHCDLHGNLGSQCSVSLSSVSRGTSVLAAESL